MNSPSRRPQEHTAETIAAEDARIDWPAVESIVHCDPAGRGLASFRRDAAPLDAGQLRASALNLAHHASRVAIVTGFCAQSNERVAAETDGPPGALFLAGALQSLGVDVLLISDHYGLPLLEAGCDRRQLSRSVLLEFPFEDGAEARARNGPSWDKKTDHWLETFFASDRGRGLSHVIAIERAGPSHTLDSFQMQPRANAAPAETFVAEVPTAERDLCHNMRGQSINGWTAKTHRLFEWIREKQLPVTTIGIGDGGNEIGMGRFAWELLVEAIGSEPAGRIACRIATDFTLIAGVSNWAAYALALATCRLRGRADSARNWTVADERDLIEIMVRDARALDGATLRHEPTVDGLPLDTYLQPFTAMRKLLSSDGKIC